jgi:hypothetical protein
MAATNMSCLTPEAALSGDCGFLSANMYARSLFGKFAPFPSLMVSLTGCWPRLGEDALANLSVERLEDGTLQGHVRIRSKTQGYVLIFVAGRSSALERSLFLVSFLLLKKKNQDRPCVRVSVARL